MSLPNSSEPVSGGTPLRNAADHACLECARTLNPAAGQNICADCAIRNLLNLSLHQAASHNSLPLLSHPDRDLTCDATGAPHLVDPLKPEQQIGPFRIIRRIGRGGMGTVYEAQDCENQRRVALKVLSRPVANDEARQRFLREGRLAASINHPNSVFVFGTHQFDSLSMISMELVRGGTLEGHLRRHGPMASRDAVDIALQLIDGLVAAHEKGILHRDIKPSNCFLADDGSVKIGDFGLSISSDPELQEKITTPGLTLGTPAFSSPEQLRGDALDVRSDIYALGSTLYFLLTGKTPFTADGVVKMIAQVLEGTAVEPHQLNPEMPVELSQVVMRCLSKEPGDRFRTYQELRTALLPLGATTADPASLGLRAIAEGIEWLALLLIGFAMVSITNSSALRFFYSKFALSTVSAATLLSWIGAYCLYYAVTESQFGCSLGKWLLQLRVVDSNHNRPTFLSAFVRAAVFLLVPAIPQLLYWLTIQFQIDQFQITSPPNMVHVAIGLSAICSYWFLLAALFLGARSQNGWQGIHERISGTRVVQRSDAPVNSMANAVGLEEQLATEQSIGPYTIVGQMTTNDGSTILIGFDTLLLRRVWIRNAQHSTCLTTHPEIARATRLRWLNRVEAQSCIWDVFEYVEGRPLVDAVGEQIDWNSVRHWLNDLQHEFSVATEQETLPQSLTINNLWLTKGGRLKLLDFAAPLLNQEGILDGATPHAQGSHSAKDSVRLPQGVSDGNADSLLVSVAHLLKRTLLAKHSRALPPPLFVTQMLDRLAGSDSLATKLDELRAAVIRPQKSDRKRRLLMSAACYAIPILLTVASLGSELINYVHYKNNEELCKMVAISNIAMFNAQNNNDLYADAKTIIVSRLNSLADDKRSHREERDFVTSLSSLNQRFRDDLSLALKAPTPGPAEVAAAWERVEADPRYKVWQDFPSINWFHFPLGPLMVGPITLLLFVAVPALVAGLLFRGGLVVYGFRTEIVNRNGYPASRGRILLRNLLPAGSVLAVCLLWNLASTDPPGLVIAGLVAFYGLAVVSNLVGLRSLSDRIVGTAVVSRD